MSPALELLERLEDAADLEEVRSALSGPDNAEPIPWERLKADLDLSAFGGAHGPCAATAGRVETGGL